MDRLEEGMQARASAAVERAIRLAERTDASLSASQQQLARQMTEIAELRSKVANLEIALATNRRIGQAIGIIMARERVTEDVAFDALVRCSQRAHRKLRDIAEQVVTTGQLPSVA